ncbi:hypothetical protein V5O48_018360 [Marasmius crinis-equi]|uniref:RING-type domain-containing protein n=1 Tax=Marasmius crinis-equi TaxID=585013 RepID=A0ABR3ELE1_9AGAR
MPRVASERSPKKATPPPSPYKLRVRPPPSPEQQVKALNAEVQRLQRNLQTVTARLQTKDTQIVNMKQLLERYGEEITLRRQLQPVLKKARQVAQRYQDIQAFNKWEENHERSYFECQCGRLFVNPAHFDCGHNLCGHCISMHLQRSPAETKNQCPHPGCGKAVVFGPYPARELAEMTENWATRAGVTLPVSVPWHWAKVSPIAFLRFDREMDAGGQIRRG